MSSPKVTNLASSVASSAAEAATTSMAIASDLRPRNLPRAVRDSPHLTYGWLQGRVRQAVASAVSTLRRLEDHLLDVLPVVRRSPAPPISLSNTTSRAAKHLPDTPHDIIRLPTRSSSTHVLVLPSARLTPLSSAAAAQLRKVSDLLRQRYSCLRTQREAKVRQQARPSAAPAPRPTLAPLLLHAPPSTARSSDRDGTTSTTSTAPLAPSSSTTPSTDPPPTPSASTLAGPTYLADLTATVEEALLAPLPPEYHRDRLVRKANDASPSAGQVTLWKLGRRYAIPPTRAQAVDLAICNAYETSQLSYYSTSALATFQLLTPRGLQGGSWVDPLPASLRNELSASGATSVPLRNDRDPGVTFCNAAAVPELIHSALTKMRDEDSIIGPVTPLEATLGLRRARDSFARIFPDTYSAHDHEHSPAPISATIKHQTLAKQGLTSEQVNTKDLPARIVVDGRALPSASLPRHFHMFIESLSARHRREISGGGPELAGRIRGAVVPPDAEPFVTDVVSAFPSLRDTPVADCITDYVNHESIQLPTRRDPASYTGPQEAELDRITLKDLHDIIITLFLEGYIIDSNSRTYKPRGLIIGGRESSGIAKIYIAIVVHKATILATSRGFRAYVGPAVYVDDSTGIGTNIPVFFDARSEVAPEVKWDDGRIWGPSRDKDEDRVLDVLISLPRFDPSLVPPHMQQDAFFDGARSISTAVAIKTFPAPFVWTSFAPRSRRTAGFRAHLRRAATICSTLAAMQKTVAHAVHYARSANTPIHDIRSEWRRIAPTLPWPALPITPFPTSSHLNKMSTGPYEVQTAILGRAGCTWYGSARMRYSSHMSHKSLVCDAVWLCRHSQRQHQVADLF